jgi:hypothetical protein
MTKEEELLILLHDNWCSWAQSVMFTEKNLSQERIDRWTKCLVEYKDLPEKYKEKSKLVAEEILRIVLKP